MARSTFVKSAQKDIYENGKYVKYKSLKGKRAGEMKEKLDRTVPKNATDKIFIAKGESYYWWQFKNGPKHISKDAPKQSQLTQSNYLGQLYSIQEQMDEIESSDPSEIESIIDNIKSDIESLKEETEGSLENMPESLQSSPTGELLQERIDSLDSAISEFEGIDFDYEEPDDEDIKDELKDEYVGEGEEEDHDWEPTPELIEERKQEKASDWIAEKIEEIQGISLE